ncbi:YdcF family protein [Microvirga sp. STS02]|uniref:YdcF family protein n=1 Tax=Hymenobacter negativus TaxID=2795026 RepID=UPI0018DCA1F4|nr:MULTISPECIES: YdcF family protein [Bacteria]MBH8569705.1 YdcF family protein [Hymenobacter negativus]MBR7209443.1 YdcF family protein [Microvirga sp. STS02]
MRLYRFAKISLVALLLWFIGHTTYIVIDGLTDEGKTADIAVILGSKVNANGTLSGRLEQRLACGLQLYLNGRAKKIIVSGGLGKEGFWEGSKMKDFLIRHHVPDTAIIVDNHGDNTLATVKNTLRLRNSLGYNSVVVVSQYFHLTRTKMLFRKQQFTSISSVSPRYFEVRDAYALLREFAAYYIE